MIRTMLIMYTYSQDHNRLHALTRQASYHAEREDRGDAEDKESRSEVGVGKRLSHGRHQGEDGSCGVVASL